MKQIKFGNQKNVISSSLKSIRMDRHLSQSQLAVKMQLLDVNIDQQMISRIEKNQRQVTDYEFACLCLCLDVSPTEMLKVFYSDLK